MSPRSGTHFGRQLQRPRSKGETTVSPFFYVLLWGGSLLLLACQAEQRESQAEFSRLSRGIDQLRDAENAAKSDQLSRLEQIACKHHCQLKKVCTSAYARHVEGVQMLAEAQRMTKSSRKNDSAALSLLTDAEAQLKASRPGTTACAATENDIERALKSR